MLLQRWLVHRGRAPGAIPAWAMLVILCCAPVARRPGSTGVAPFAPCTTEWQWANAPPANTQIQPQDQPTRMAHQPCPSPASHRTNNNKEKKTRLQTNLVGMGTHSLLQWNEPNSQLHNITCPSNWTASTVVSCEFGRSWYCTVGRRTRDSWYRLIYMY